MTDQKNKEEKLEKNPEETEQKKPEFSEKKPESKVDDKSKVKDFSRTDSKSGPRSRMGKNTRRQARAKPEFDQKIVDIRRVARVVAGGRRFSFSVSIVAGNKKGSVGVGIGKASDTPLAIEKAFRDAQKNMIKVNLTESFSIPFEVKGKSCSSQVIIIPTPGKGVLAGSSVRDVIELVGIKDVSAKLLSRSKNKFNNARAAIEALKKF